MPKRMTATRNVFHDMSHAGMYLYTVAAVACTPCVVSRVLPIAEPILRVKNVLSPSIIKGLLDDEELEELPCGVLDRTSRILLSAGEAVGADELLPAFLDIVYLNIFAGLKSPFFPMPHATFRLRGVDLVHFADQACRR